jgi:hypothetical protein
MSHHQADHAAAPAWRWRFEALVRQRMHTPFAWGVQDCCLFAADAVATITGRDPAAAWRGTYSTALQAARLVAELGGLRAIGTMAGPGIPPLSARVGDIGLVQSHGQALLGVCTGPCWLVPAGAGLAAHDLSAAHAAWSVAHA